MSRFLTQTRKVLIALSAACLASTLAASQAALAQLNRAGCVPVEQRAGREVGCYILLSEKLGRLSQDHVFWYLYSYPNRATAEAVKSPGDSVFESLGKTWLSHIGPSGWQARSGERIAEIGPLPVHLSADYNAVYMEAIFTPGLRARVHRHSGPEAWYTAAGETCLETPDKIYLGRAGGPPVIVPEGPPMALTATGTEMRKAVVLILHDASKPATTLTSDWTPKGECDKYLPK